MTADKFLDHIYDTFGPAEEGEDYGFGLTQSEVEIAATQANYLTEVNAIRKAHGILTWDGVVAEHYAKVRAETDPNALTDRLLELAASAVAFGNSVQRRAAAFNALSAAPVEDEEHEQEEE